jgi:beta-lactamase regulating signal transducer with metallopeptidase domain
MSDVLWFSIRAALILLPALAVARWSRRLSASTRHALCLAALIGVLALPLFSSLLPDVSLPVLPAVDSAAGPAGSTRSVFLAGLWLGGVLVVGARILSGVIRARLLCRLAREVTDARVLTAAIRVRRELGLKRPIRVLFQRRLGVPFTWGVVRPIVLLPASAAAWGPSRLRAVLLHELTHVRRHDCLTQLLADTICAVYWFHPLVWMAAARMRAERENACDDTVVGRGARPSGYASLLVRMVETVKYGGLAAEPVAAFGGGSGLAGRLRVLLGSGRDRRALSPPALAAFVLGALTLLLPVAAVRLTHAAPDVPARAEVFRAGFAEPTADPAAEPLAESFAAAVAASELEPLAERIAAPVPTSKLPREPLRRAEWVSFRVFGFVKVHVQVGGR